VPPIILNFNPSTQELGPLLEAANRLMSDASCHIDSSPDRYICRLIPKTDDPNCDKALRTRFFDLLWEANRKMKVVSICGRAIGASKPSRP
jgi:hypothetical protein